MKGLFLKQPEMDQMRLILRHRQTLLFSAFLSASLCPSMAREVTLQMIKDEVEGIKRDINAGWLVICGVISLIVHRIALGLPRVRTLHCSSLTVSIACHKKPARNF